MTFEKRGGAVKIVFKEIIIFPLIFCFFSILVCTCRVRLGSLAFPGRALRQGKARWPSAEARGPSATAMGPSTATTLVF